MRSLDLKLLLLNLIFFLFAHITLCTLFIFSIVIHCLAFSSWSDTRGYATPATLNALFGHHNWKFSQNNTRGSHLKAFISPQIKTILWLSVVVLTDIVRVSEPTVCIFRLSVYVFTPLPDGGEKTQNPGSDILNLGSRKFWKFPKTRSFI